MHYVPENVSNAGGLTVPKSGLHRPIPAHVLNFDFLFTLRHPKYYTCFNLNLNSEQAYLHLPGCIIHLFLNKQPKGQWSLTWVQCAKVNLPQNLKQPFPHPNDATNKIWSRLTSWLQRYSSSKVWNFHHSRASNSKMSGLIRPKSNSTELLCLSWIPATLMMIWSKMIKLAWRHHFPIISF